MKKPRKLPNHGQTMRIGKMSDEVEILGEINDNLSRIVAQMKELVAAVRGYELGRK